MERPLSADAYSASMAAACAIAVIATEQGRALAADRRREVLELQLVRRLAGSICTRSVSPSRSNQDGRLLALAAHPRIVDLDRAVGADQLEEVALGHVDPRVELQRVRRRRSASCPRTGGRRRRSFSRCSP